MWEHPPAEETVRGELRRRLSWLMGGRLTVATLLMGATFALAIDHEQGMDGHSARVLLALIVATYSLSLVFAVWLRQGRRLLVLSGFQLGWDLLLTTSLIYVSGGASSGFTFLYGLSALMAALMLGSAAALLTTATAVTCYVSISLGLVLGVVNPPDDQPLERYQLSTADAAFAISVNVLSLLVVAVLANNLAQRLRSAGGQLRAATEHADSLARLNANIIRSLSSGLVTTDPEWTIRTINPAGLEILRARPSQVLGRHLRDFMEHEEAQSPDRRRSTSQGQRANGDVFPVGFTKSDLLDSHGQSTGNLIVFQDLTEITELREAAERAERLAALGRVAAALAHEIRNPLSAISGSVELVADGPSLQKEDQHLLSIVSREVDRLSDLVTTMLDVARPTRPQRTHHDLRELARDVAYMASQDRLRPLQARIDLEVPDEPVIANLDTGQMRQLLWNLVKNALQHSPPNGTVRLRVGRENLDVWLEVTDQGPGIAEEARARLFDMFYSRREHGIGLGLALCKQIVEAHAGTIEVLPAKPHGSRFVARCPAEEPSSS